MKKDDLYSGYRERVADFVFDENVAAVFDDMIHRSVPGYGTVLLVNTWSIITSRPHQGIGNNMIAPLPQGKGKIVCHERLGGLLKKI